MNLLTVTLTGPLTGPEVDADVLQKILPKHTNTKIDHECQAL